MSAESSGNSSPGEAGGYRMRWLEWSVVTSVVCILLFLGAARLPQQVKVPFLLSGGLAAMVSMGLGMLANSWQLASPGRVGAILALAVSAGFFAGSYDTHHRFAEFTRNEPVRNTREIEEIDAELLKSLDEGELPEGATNLSREEMKQVLALQRERTMRQLREREFRQTFLGYLTFRIPREWGTWPVAAAVAFWLAELGLAAGLAARVGAGQIQSRHTPDPPPTSA